MAKRKTLKAPTPTETGLSCVNFIKGLLWDIYQYFYNFPFIIFALMTCRNDYQILQPPHFSSLILPCLNCCIWVILLPVTFIDLLSEAIVDAMEVAYTATVYYAVYLGAAIGCCIVGDYPSLTHVREWMTKYYFQQEDKGVENEVTEELHIDGSKKALTANGHTPANERKTSKVATFSKKDESGYLTEEDVEVES